MKKLIFAVCCLGLLAGCASKQETEKEKDQAVATGELRHKLFVECMYLAAKMPRQSDDDVADIVGECSSQAYYMAKHMSR